MHVHSISIVPVTHLLATRVYVGGTSLLTHMCVCVCIGVCIVVFGRSHVRTRGHQHVVSPARHLPHDRLGDPSYAPAQQQPTQHDCLLGVNSRFTPFHRLPLYTQALKLVSTTADCRLGPARLTRDIPALPSS